MPATAAARPRSSKTNGSAFGTSCTGRVDRITHGYLVTDDEDRPFRPVEQRRKGLREAPGCVVECLAAGKRLSPRALALPRSIFGDRLSFELADAHVVEL